MLSPTRERSLAREQALARCDQFVDRHLPTVVRRGATIGANATIVCGNEIGAYSFIAAGAVVT